MLPVVHRALLLLALAGALPSISAPLSLDQYVRHAWQADEGLPQNSVNAIAQTPDGYLWMATEGGLARFDGFQFSVFEKRNTPVLSSNVITALLVDRDGTLWIGTEGGGLIRYRHAQFEPAPWNRRLVSETILSLHQDKQGTLWIGTEGSGLFSGTSAGLKQYSAPQGLPASSVFAIASDNAGDLWLGTQRGLSRVLSGSSKILPTPVREEVRSLYADPAGTIWVGARNGLFSSRASNPAQFDPVPALHGLTVSSILEDREHTLWVGTLETGLHHLVGGKLADLDKSGGVLSLFQDKAGTLWVGTAETGLLSLRQGSVIPLTTAEGLAGNVSLATYQDRSGAMWIGSDKGLTRWKAGVATTFTTRQGLPDNLVYSVAEDGTGTLWAGTRKGLARKQGNLFHPITAGLPFHSDITAAFTDFDGSLWVGSRGGLAHLRGSHWVPFTAQQGMPDRVVTAIARDRQNQLWAGTAGGGLFSIDETARRVRSFTVSGGLPSNVIYCLLADSDGPLWIGTNNGLARFANGRFQTLPKSAGLIDDTVLGILDDRLGNLWLSSNRGIQRIPKNGAIGPARAFNLSDGMKGRECTGGFQPSAWRSSDGQLWFPTLKGVVSIDPAHAPILPPHFPPVLESVLVGNRLLSPFEPSTIPPGKRQVEFRFTAPGAAAPEKLAFSYQLAGFDRDWVAAGARRIAYYTNLPAGHFQFRFRACLDDACAESPSPLAVSVEPAFYETAWFFVLTAITLIAIAFLLHRFRVRALRARERELLHLVQIRQEAELKATAASRAKSEFLTNMSHELRTPLNGIMGMTDLVLSTELDQDQDEYLQIIKSSADSLLRIVNDILDFSQMESTQLVLAPFDLAGIAEQIRQIIAVRLQAKGLVFSLNLASDLPADLLGDPGRLRQVLLNLLDNALKFTAKGSISLSISTVRLTGDSCVLRFEVRDTGIGIPKDKLDSIFDAFSQADTSSTRKFGGTGLGLAICRQLVTLMHGQIYVESIEGGGSTFSFTAEFQLAVRVERAA